MTQENKIEEMDKFWCVQNQKVVQPEDWWSHCPCGIWLSGGSNSYHKYEDSIYFMKTKNQIEEIKMETELRRAKKRVKKAIGTDEGVYIDWHDYRDGTKFGFIKYPKKYTDYLEGIKQQEEEIQEKQRQQIGKQIPEYCDKVRKDHPDWSVDNIQSHVKLHFACHALPTWEMDEFMPSWIRDAKRDHYRKIRHIAHTYVNDKRRLREGLQLE